MPDIEEYLPGLKDGVVTIAGIAPSAVVTNGGEVRHVLRASGMNDDVPIQSALNAVRDLGGGQILLKRGTYNLSTTLVIAANTQLIGEEASTTILKMAAGRNVSVIRNRNKDSTTIDRFIRLANLTIDQQGASQTAGGGISMSGIQDCSFENLIVEKSYIFNTIIVSEPGTNLSGTLTFTAGDPAVVGTDTIFTTQLVVGDIIKTAAGRFGRVANIESDISVELERIWGHSTETDVVTKLVRPNARNRILNCYFKGTINLSDNVGLGLFDDSLVFGCVSRDSDDGYGFGPDHCSRVKFIGNTCIDNDNSGIGIETCGNSTFSDNHCYGNGNGIYLLSGAFRNTISNNQCRHNTNGIQVTYNSTSFPRPDENTIIGNVCELNATHGIRVGGAARTVVCSNRCANNATTGIVVVTDNAVVPDKTSILGNHCYQNPNAVGQNRGIHIVNGTNTLVTNNVSSDGDNVE